MSLRMCWFRWLATAALLGLAILVAPTARAASALTVVVIPGDQATLQMVAAARLLKQEAAFAQVTFRVLPQSLLTPADVAALAQADVVFARHMVGSVSQSVGAAMQALAAKGKRLYGVGQNEGASSQLGLTEDLALRTYADAGGTENWANMVRFALRRDHGFATQALPVRELPQVGALDWRTGELFENFEAYAAAYQRHRPGDADKPWVGMVLSRGQAVSGQDESLGAMARALEARGFNVLPVYGFPSTVPVQTFFLDGSNRPRVQAVVAVAMKIGNVPDRIGPLLERLNVPLINAITLYKSTQKEWENSPLGLDQNERSWQISGAELAGIVAPTVVASKERRQDAQTGLEYVAEVPIAERVERMADRVRKLVDLRTTEASNKRVAIVYYNYPAGKHNVGASYLNVMPRSLWQILTRLEAEGYTTQNHPKDETALFERLQQHGTNVADTTPGALQALVASGQAVLLPVAQYRQWFDAQPQALRASMVRSWGEPEAAKTMVWTDKAGKAHFVFPAQRYGNLLFAPQPVRGWGDVKKMYHDVALAPHHQYLAFYLWLQKDFQAHAMVHVGTHGTHEWLPGKEVGFTAADPSEAMVGDVPQVYPYSVDVVGEGLQAKRRGMATLISHMTPPFDKAGLNPDLLKLHGLFDDYGVAKEQSNTAAAAALTDINRLARKMGLLKDLGRDELKNADDIEALHDYLHEVEETQTPLGLHTLGVAPSEELRRSTADAMVERMGPMMPAEFEQKVQALSALMLASARAELDALVAALAGRYVAAGPGGDPLRSPASLPTGKNLYGFDPSRIPSNGTYNQGVALANTLMADYRSKNGVYPDRLLFNLWSGETMRHGGVIEAQILSLMGVRPKWDVFGRIVDVELISRAELGRPRVDVVLTPSGLYRDSLPMLMLLIDKAVNAVKDLPEDDNPVRANVQRARQALEARGVPVDEAMRMAAVRMFTEPPGAYGTGLDNVIRAGNTWNTEAQVVDVYFNRVGHLFGQGYWGSKGDPSDKDSAPGTSLAIDVFKLALKDVKMVLHSTSSNLYGTLDNDDVYQYMGGAAMAIRYVTGTSPQTQMVNLSDPSRSGFESLDKYMGREMRTRYLNPVWINAMFNEGYAGARLMHQVVDNLWGWQVTVPGAVDSAKWQEFFEVYVQDKHNLKIAQRFREARNTLAFQAMVDRMLVAVNKGYWKASPQVVAKLEAMNRQLIAQAGASCDRDSCSSPAVTALAEQIDAMKMQRANAGFGLSAAGAAASPSANPPATPQASPQAAAQEPSPSPPAPNAVKGMELRERPSNTPVQQIIWTYGILILLIVLGGIGWQALRYRREKHSLKTT